MSQTFEPARSAQERPRSRGIPDGTTPGLPARRVPSQPVTGVPGAAQRAQHPDDDRTRLLPGAGLHRASGRADARTGTTGDALTDPFAAPAQVSFDAQAVAFELEAPLMALVGAGGGAAGQSSPRSSLWDRPVVPSNGDTSRSRGERRPTVQANAAADDGGNRRGRSGSGPAAARALGSKIVPDGGGSGGPGGSGGGRGNDRVRNGGGRRYMPLRDEVPDEPEAVPPGIAAPPPGQHAVPVLSGDGSAVPPYTVPADPAAPWGVEEQAPSITAAFGASLADPGYGDTGATRIVRPVGAPDAAGPRSGYDVNGYAPDVADHPAEHLTDYPPPGYADDVDLPAADGPAPSLVRPYARTGGRTKPGHELDLEALVVTTVNGREAWSSPLLNPEHVQVIGLCMDTTSVAEVAARLSVPIGVARVIIADMVDLGLVEVGKTSANTGDERDPAFLRRVLSGLQRL